MEMKKPFPWRRFFARSLDVWSIELLLGAVISLGLHKNWLASNALEDRLYLLIAQILLLFVEPAMLALFGTTLGKWIFGIRVTSNDGHRLSYAQALKRTWMMFLCGMGLGIPIYDLIRSFTSYRQCMEGDTLEWEYDSQIILKDRNPARIAAYIGSYVVAFGVVYLIGVMALMPKHRGDITVVQFCENYNQLADYLDCGTDYYIKEDGTIKESSDDTPTMRITQEMPKYEFKEQDGRMRGLSFSQNIKNNNLYVYNYNTNIALCMMALAKAQQGCSPFSKEVDNIIQNIEEKPFEDFEYEAFGIKLTYKVKYSGYFNTGDMLVPEDNTKPSFLALFTMEKQ